MYSFRKEQQARIQQMYGGYCNEIRAYSMEPMPYYEFSDYVEKKDYNTKQIIAVDLEKRYYNARTT